MPSTTPVQPNPVDKHDARRRALATPIQDLGELGYAKFSLREMANHSEFAHSIMHYYFADKLELIVYCVRCKAACSRALRRGRRGFGHGRGAAAGLRRQAARDGARGSPDAPALV